MKKIQFIRTGWGFGFVLLSQIWLVIATNAISEKMWMSIAVCAATDGFYIWIIWRQKRIRKIRSELQKTETAWRIEQEHYQQIEARRAELAKIRREITDYFSVMEEYMQDAKYDRMHILLDRLVEYVAATKEYIYCGDPIVNAILSENEKKCREMHIELSYEFGIPSPLQMNPVAVCSMFSNLMRNAIAAAEESSRETSRAFVDIKAITRGDYLHIVVKNSYLSTAKKRDRRGYGREILRELADRYHGEMKTEADGKIYKVYFTAENREEQQDVSFS